MIGSPRGIVAIAATLFCFAQAGHGKEISIFKADCIALQTRICIGLIGSKDNRPVNRYGDCKQMEGNAKIKPPTHNNTKVFKSNFPDGCGRALMSKALSISDCADAAKTAPQCLDTIEMLTASDVKLARESFTEQLDAWLKMLESAGAVRLDAALKGADEAAASPGPGN